MAPLKSPLLAPQPQLEVGKHLRSPRRREALRTDALKRDPKGKPKAEAGTDTKKSPVANKMHKGSHSPV